MTTLEEFVEERRFFPLITRFYKLFVQNYHRGYKGFVFTRKNHKKKIQNVYFPSNLTQMQENLLTLEKKHIGF